MEGRSVDSGRWRILLATLHRHPYCRIPLTARLKREPFATKRANATDANKALEAISGWRLKSLSAIVARGARDLKFALCRLLQLAIVLVDAVGVILVVVGVLGCIVGLVSALFDTPSRGFQSSLALVGAGADD